MAQRFYQPSSGQYVSQFVPDQLPADLMLRSLGAKQQAYDTQADLNEQLAALNIRSLPGEDTRYAKQYKEKIQKFVDESYGQDLSSPDFQRKYKQFVKEYKNDSGLKSVAQAVATHDEYLERVKELEKKGEFAAAEEMRNNYNRRFNLYTATDGLGYRGEVSLGDPIVGEGVDRFKENLKFFEPLKESGSENIGFLEEGISYKSGWAGINDQRVRQQADRMFNDWLSSPGGKQTVELYNMQNGVGDYELSKLSPEKKEEYKKELDNFLKNEFLEVGRSVVHGKSTTNMDHAYNIRNRRAYQEEKERAASPILTDQLQGIEVANPNLSWEAQIRGSQRTIDKLTEQYSDVKENPNRYAPGTLQSLKSQLDAEYGKIELIKKDKEKKYNDIYQKNLNLNTSGINTAKSKLSKSTLNLIDQEGNLSRLVGYSNEGATAIAIDQLRETAAYKKLPESEKRALLEYRNQLNSAENARRQAKINTDKEWKETYYSGDKADNIEYMGVTTIPNHKGSTGQVEQNMINTVRDGYTFYDEKGKEITKDDLGFDFKIGGITQENFQGNTRGRVGTVTKQTPIYDDNGKFVKYQKTPIRVIAVPRDPNYKVTNNIYAREYYEQAELDERNGNIESAENSRRMAMGLMNSDLANKFDQAEKSERFNSGPITINVSASDGKSVSLSKANVMLDKLEDGTYNVSVKNTNGSNLIAPKNFNDVKAAQKYVLNFGL